MAQFDILLSEKEVIELARTQLEDLVYIRLQQLRIAPQHIRPLEHQQVESWFRGLPGTRALLTKSLPANTPIMHCTAACYAHRGRYQLLAFVRLTSNAWVAYRWQLHVAKHRQGITATWQST